MKIKVHTKWLRGVAYLGLDCPPQNLHHSQAHGSRGDRYSGELSYSRPFIVGTVTSKEGLKESSCLTPVVEPKL
jgi:hypothetical protein